MAMSRIVGHLIDNYMDLESRRILLDMAEYIISTHDIRTVNIKHDFRWILDDLGYK